MSRKLAGALGLVLAACAAGPHTLGASRATPVTPVPVRDSAFSVLRSPFSVPAVPTLPVPGTPLPVPGTPSPAHLRLFTPLGAPRGAYVVTVIAAPMAQARPRVMRALGVADAPPAPGSSGAAGPQAWAVQRLEVAEAFGASGPYEPIRLARLFNGRRVEVARGPVVRDGRTIASLSLISPYPDPSFSRIEPGTLVIALLLR